MIVFWRIVGRNEESKVETRKNNIRTSLNTVMNHCAHTFVTNGTQNNYTEPENGTKVIQPNLLLTILFELFYKDFSKRAIQKFLSYLCSRLIYLYSYLIFQF